VSGANREAGRGDGLGVGATDGDRLEICHGAGGDDEGLGTGTDADTVD
jgi:hypothetical protein